MKCWHCKEELIWGGDNIIEDEEGANLMITNLSCPGCEASVDVYLPQSEVFDA